MVAATYFKLYDPITVTTIFKIEFPCSDCVFVYFIHQIYNTTSQQSTWNSSTVRQSTAQAQNSTASNKHQRRSGSKLCVIFGVSERNGTESGPNGRNSHRHRKHHRPSFGHGRWRRRRLWWVIRGALTYRTPPHSKVDDDVSNGFPPQGNHFFFVAVDCREWAKWDLVFPPRHPFIRPASRGAVFTKVISGPTTGQVCCVCLLISCSDESEKVNFAQQWYLSVMFELKLVWPKITNGNVSSFGRF